MNADQKTPVPDYIVLCSDSMEWKAHAEVVASLGRSVLLIGACDDDFVERLRAKYNLCCEAQGKKGDVLLWNPAQTGFDCHQE